MGNSKATTTSEDYCPTDSLTNQEGERERECLRGGMGWTVCAERSTGSSSPYVATCCMDRKRLRESPATRFRHPLLPRVMNSGQAYKHFMTLNYNSTVVIWANLESV